MGARMIERRSILGFLASLPVSGWKMSSPGKAKCEGERLAVQVMRFVNTVECWQRELFGSYVGRASLARSPVLKRFRSEERLERAGLGRSLLDRMTLDKEEVVPGWKLQIHLTPSLEGRGKGYVSVITSTYTEDRRAFASDQRGVIHRGALPSGGLSGSLISSLPDLVWDDQGPLSNYNHRSGFGRVLAAALLFFPDYPTSCGTLATCGPCLYEGCPCLCAPAYALCCCCFEGGSPTCTDVGTSNCCNVGCSGCVWCCCV